MIQTTGLNQLALDLLKLESGAEALIQKTTERLAGILKEHDFNTEDIKEAADYYGGNIAEIESVLKGDINGINEVLFSEVADAICWQVGCGLTDIIKPSNDLTENMKDRLIEKSLNKKMPGPIAYSSSLPTNDVKDGEVQEREFLAARQAHLMLKQLLNHCYLQSNASQKAS